METARTPVRDKPEQLKRKEKTKRTYVTQSHTVTNKIFYHTEKGNIIYTTPKNERNKHITKKKKLQSRKIHKIYGIK